jgi:hypothetical protein
MKKRHVDHVLRAAGRITGERQFIIIGSQSLHAKFPDLADEIGVSVEVDLIAKAQPARGELLNAIGQDSQFHVTHGYYADPVDMNTAVLPKGWRGRLVNLPPGDTEGVAGLCLDPHDLAISKYVARREKDIEFTREMARRKLVDKERLLDLVRDTPVDDAAKRRLRSFIERDFRAR